jgi:glycosyltransferase involved in cell wall biosynthesis
MQVTCLVKRWEHHTPSGGYGQLATAVGANVVMRQRVTALPARAARKVWQRLTPTGSYLLDYQFGDFLAELKVILSSAVFSPPDVVHVLYGDEQLDQLLRLRRFLPCPLVASFHLPPDRACLSHRFEDSRSYVADRLDAAIVVATSQIAQFQNWFGPAKVAYVPHGVDTTKFSPDKRPIGRPRLRLLIVGEHMRDWQVIHTVIDTTNGLHLPVSFDVVTAERNFAHFTGCENTSLHEGICETSLIQLYRNADAVLMPVTNATANNSVLESLACGTPVISTSIGGIADYVNDQCGWLFTQGDTWSIVNLVEAMCRNRDVAESRRESARRQALTFSWPRIAERLFAVYSAVRCGRPPAEALIERDGTKPRSPVVAISAVEAK